MKYNRELVLKVNELFHDFECENYEKKHKDIFSGELMRWHKISKKYISTYSSPVKILDIGTGTGFVPIAIAAYFKKNDTFICSDISQEMLKTAKTNIEQKGFQCDFIYLKTESNRVQGNNINIVTMNSVLHHIPDLQTFFWDLSGKITEGGIIIIGHEPNKKFYRHKLLLNLYLILSTLSSLKLFLLKTVRLLRVNVILRKFFYKQLPENYIKINKILKKEGLIESDLSQETINKLIDFNSPSAGNKIDKSKGIDIEEILSKYLPDFEIEYFETYNYLSKISDKNKLFRRLDKYLSRKYKNFGATFFAVLKKNK